MQHNYNNQPNNKKQDTVFYTLITILVILVIIFLVFTFVCTPVKIKGESMSPSLLDGNLIMISKIHKLPKVGDVVVYKKPDEKNTKVIKRVVGVEGDTFTIHTNSWGNGGVLKKVGDSEFEYILRQEQFEFLTNKYNTSFTLQKDEIFTIGDNVSNSIDCRNYGAINISSVIGIMIE